MRRLKDILSHPYTDAEYLERQRKLMKPHCEKATAEIMRHKGDDNYIEEKKKTYEGVMHNMFVLPGSMGKPIDVGTPIAWHEVRTADQEYIWHLNRMYYLVDLTEIFLLTGEKRYLDKVLFDLENWIDSCPLPDFPLNMKSRSEMSPEVSHSFLSTSPWRLLEVGIRMFDCWQKVYDLLLETEYMTPEFHSKLAVSMYEHGFVISRLSALIFPGANANHYLHEMLGLLNVSVRFPDFRNSADWLEFALFDIGRCAEVQLTEDGGHIEGCPCYHAVCYTQFLIALEVAKEYGVSLNEKILRLYDKAAEYSAFTVCPDGKWAAIGDTPIIVGIENNVYNYYKCFGDLGPFAKTVALIPDLDNTVIPEKVLDDGKKESERSTGSVCYQRKLDHFIARTGFSADDSYFYYLCHTPVVNGHSHIDLQSFVLYLNGKSIVVDPSYYAYRECPERREVKSATYHSTLTFDGKDPYEYLGTWSYTPQKEGHLYGTYVFDDVMAADGSHDNYLPNEHRRLCALIGKDTFIVADDVKNKTGVDVRLYFHIDDPEVIISGKEAISDKVRIIIPDGVESELADSYKSPMTDLKEPTRRLVLTDRNHSEKAEYLTVFTQDKALKNAEITRTDGGLKITLYGAKTRCFVWEFAKTLKEI